MRRLTILLALSIALAACGQIGPLYMPNDPHPPVYVPPKPAPAASAIGAQD